MGWAHSRNQGQTFLSIPVSISSIRTSLANALQKCYVYAKMIGPPRDRGTGGGGGDCLEVLDGRTGLRWGDGRESLFSARALSALGVRGEAYANELSDILAYFDSLRPLGS